MELCDAVEEYIEQEKMNRFEGRTGVENLCRLVHAMGYKDAFHFGQFAHDGAIGDLIDFLEDNPGCQEAILDWIKDCKGTDWADELESCLPEKPEDPEEE